MRGREKRGIGAEEVIWVPAQEHTDFGPNFAMPQLFAMDEQECSESRLTASVSITWWGHDDQHPIVKFVFHVGGRERAW